MLYLKATNLEDIEEEYKALTNIPINENGLENNYFGCSFEEFKTKIVKTLIDNSKGVNLKEGYVPCTYYFLWNDNKIIGLFKIRHELNETLKNSGGHIGYTILKEYRGKGYATKGLSLAIEECKKIIKENEIYMSVLKTNAPSLKVQLNNGAKIVRENEDHYFTRLKIK